MKEEKLWALVGGGIAALILIGYVFWLRAAYESSVVKVATSTAQSAKTGAATVLKKDTGGSHAGLSYAEALRLYKSRHIEFDPNCVATPNNMSIRNGNSVMFDNRAASSTTIALDGVRYLIRGRDFRILTLRSSRLPHTVLVDCGSGRNNAFIILQ